ncbi:MAG TPA: endonuclease MutS2 [Dehalococcoidales bacterium]|nr:endonuclease MutS2 [Dehalococcoidales bacterium]
MDNKSLEMLEFPRIREILAGYTSFSASRELALKLQPQHDYEDISLLLRQTAEARQLLGLERGFSVGSVLDVREKTRLAALEGILEPLSLLEIQQTLAALHELRRYLKSISEDFPLLWEIAEGIVELHQIEKDIGSCLDPAGEVLDTASPALADIRHQLRETRGQILEKLEAIVRSPRGNRILQEDIITEREGRYVILVKVECRHEVKGIVHDISNTGATVFMEPTVAVGLGNAIRELVIEERREIERILRLLSAEVGAHSDDISRSIELASGLDLVLAKARYARRIKAVEPVIIEPDPGHGAVGKNRAGLLKLVDARHPLLGDNAVPFSAELGRDFSIMVITGPNTGGKTVTLKTIGLLSLMAQSGMPIPASGESHLPLFDGVFADIGDEQSIEQTLSTFSWHMGNVVRIIRGATGNSLVLLDELGTSTDPAEGSALARAVLRYFLARWTLTVATTHYSDLKAFAHATPGLENASLEFDPETLTPTYHLTVGIPGGSNAMATAARLGIPAEIIDDARSMLTEGSQELESVLANLMSEKQKIASLQRELKAERDEFARRNTALNNELERLKSEERKAIQEARDTIVRETAELHKEIRQAAAELRKEKSAAKMEQARRTLAGVREQLDSEAWQPRVGENIEAEAGIIKVGDTVRVKEAGLTATVLSISEESGEIEVQSGRTKMRLSIDSVVKTTAPQDISPSGTQPAVRRVPLELDLRGKRADEVEIALDIYLNDAAQSNIAEARIIHGIGTGTVRSIVRDFLTKHPLVKSFRAGERDEGGDGATVVRL